MATNRETLTLLSIPPEIRNAIYAYIFVPPMSDAIVPKQHQILLPEADSSLAKALLIDSEPCDPATQKQPILQQHRAPTRLSVLLTSRKIHHEALLLALSTTTFHLRSPSEQPAHFAQQTHSLSSPQLSALKHLTLTARITHLRALNETWEGRPFGHSALQLETLTVVPRRPDAGNTAWAEVAELDQCHTLAHVLAETFKMLQGVEEVRVVNMGCFGEAVWRLVYRHLVFKVWKWGGRDCGVRFECSREGEGEEGGWFRAFLGRSGRSGHGGSAKGVDVAVEACRLLGVEGTSPSVVAGMP